MDLDLDLDALDTYFSTAIEREKIRIRRERGDSPPWSNDPIFKEWRFCNVNREDDKTTVWFRENIRSQLHGFNLVKGTFIFRWFNRIETARKILDLIHQPYWNGEECYNRLKDVHPVATGAYMLNTPAMMTRLEGILNCIETSLPVLEMQWESWGDSLEIAWEDLTVHPHHGPFMAYEVVTDLRHTEILQNAKDITTWANAGPGCARGLSRVVMGSEYYTRAQVRMHQDEMRDVMKEIVERSKTEWPFETPWEMRTAEHWSCEFHKYMNAVDGKRLKRRFSK